MNFTENPRLSTGGCPLSNSHPFAEPFALCAFLRQTGRKPVPSCASLCSLVVVRGDDLEKRVVFPLLVQDVNGVCPESGQGDG